MALPAAQHSASDTQDILAQARSLLKGGQAAQGLALLHPLLDMPQEDPAVIDCAAMCCWEMGDGANALALLGVITELWPDLFDGWAKKSAMAASLGETETAIADLKTALRLKPRSASALVALNRLEPFDRDCAQTRYLKAHAKSRKLSTDERIKVLNALGRIEERAGNHRPAFHHFSAAKAATRVPFDPDATDQLVDGQIARFDPEKLPDAIGTGPRVVFVVGMPRSGTTLTEAILGRHPDTHCIGESKALSRTLIEARRYMAAKHHGSGAWDWVGNMDAETAAAFRLRFLEHVGLPESANNKVIVDKMPLDCLDVGFARAIIPDARIVFMQRHPLDVGLSNFCTNFYEGNGFSTRLDWIGRMTAAVYRSADDYAAKLGGAYRRQSYRALVEDAESQVRALVDHVGLEWNAACLAPEEGKSMARTASMYQIREGINRKGLDKWQPYESELAPLVEALGGQEWIDAWEAQDAKATPPQP